MPRKAATKKPIKPIKKPSRPKSTDVIKKAEVLLSKRLTNKKSTVKAFDVEVDEIHKSVFKKSLDDLKTRDTTNYDESHNKEILVAMLNMVLELIPISEENYRRYKIDKAAYANNTFINQARELINDIRAIEDFQGRSEQIKHIVRQAMTMMLQNLLDQTSILRNNLVSKLALETDHKKQDVVKNIFESYLKDYGKYTIETAKSIDAQIDNFIVKVKHLPKPVKKK